MRANSRCRCLTHCVVYQCRFLSFERLQALDFGKVLRVVVLAGAAALATRGVVTAIRGEASLSSLGSNESSPCDRGLTFRLVVPVLHEQETIIGAVERFERFCRSGNAHVVFVSSDAEDARMDALRDELISCPTVDLDDDAFVSRIERAMGPELGDEAVCRARRLMSRADQRNLLLDAVREHKTTSEMIESLLARDDELRHVFHRRLQGDAPSVALQVRCGVEAELAGFGDPDYIGVYNVDSDPENDTLRAVCAKANDVLGRTGRLPDVLQQSAAFVGASGSSLRAVAQAAGIAQTRWTFCNEMVRIRRQCTNAERRFGFPFLGVCVGHGLFIRRAFFVDDGALPEFVMQEDLAYGLLMSARKVPIYSVPALDRSDVPGTLRALVRQKQQWFWACLEYPRVAGSVAGQATRLVRFALVAQGVANAILWLGVSPALLCGLLLPLVSPGRWWISAIGVGSYVLFPLVRYPAALRRRGYNIEPVDFRCIAASFAVLLTDSIGPYLAVARMISGARVSRSRTRRR